MKNYSHLTLPELEKIQNNIVSSKLREKINSHCKICLICSERIKNIKKGEFFDENAKKSSDAARRLMNDLALDAE